MSVANFGSLPRPVIVKSIVAIPALADATATDLFLITIPALTAYSYSTSGDLSVAATTAAATVGAGLIFTSFADNSPIPVDNLLLTGNIINVAGVVSPLTVGIALNGFIYNTSSADVTIKFRINVNVSAGTSVVGPARVCFVPVPVSGYSL